MKYLGVDFGLRRIGLATSEGDLASPWKIVEGRGVKDLAEKISKEAGEFDIVVVGMPEGKMGQNVRGFIRILREQDLVVEEADETLSSKKAVRVMVEVGTTKKKRRFNDAAAAAIILQNWLDSESSSS